MYHMRCMYTIMMIYLIKYNVSIMLLGDFYSRVGLKSDFEVYHEHDNYFFSEGLIILIFY